MIFVGITINSFSQRGYEIIELLCFEVLGGPWCMVDFLGGPICWGDLHRKDNWGDLKVWGDLILLGGPKTPLYTMCKKCVARYCVATLMLVDGLF